MDKIIFREYMNKKVIQKTVIFGSIYGISIDRFQPAKESSKFPYRMYFYEKNNIVGYMDATVSIIQDTIYLKSEFPFVLFTPLGNIEGKYHSSQECFAYDLDVVDKKNFDYIEGIFSISAKRDIADDEYFIRSYLKLVKEEKIALSVSLNGCASNGFLDIENYFNPEALNFNTIMADLSIRHCSHLKNSEYKCITDIEVRESNQQEDNQIYARFKFPALDDYYEKPVGIRDVAWYKSFWEKLDLEKVNEQIQEFNPRIFEFMDETREQLKFETPRGTISLYDILAFYCFKHDLTQLKIVRGKKIKDSLEHNVVLKKMKKHDHD